MNLDPNKMKLFDQLSKLQEKRTDIMKNCNTPGDIPFSVKDVYKKESYEFTSPGFLSLDVFAKKLSAMETMERLNKGEEVKLKEDVMVNGTYQNEYRSDNISVISKEISLKSVEDLEEFVRVETGAKPETEREKAAGLLESLEARKSLQEGNNNLYEICDGKGKAISSTEAAKKLEKGEEIQLKEQCLYSEHITKTGGYGGKYTKDNVSATDTDRSLTFKSFEELNDYMQNKDENKYLNKDNNSGLNVDGMKSLSELRVVDGKIQNVIKEATVNGDYTVNVTSINKTEKYEFSSPGLIGKDLTSAEAIQKLSEGKEVILEETITLKGQYDIKDDINSRDPHSIDAHKTKTVLKSVKDFEEFVRIESGAEPQTEREKMAQLLEKLEFNKVQEEGNNNFYEICNESGKVISTTDAAKKLEIGEPVHLKEKFMYTDTGKRSNSYGSWTVAEVHTKYTGKDLTFKSADELKDFFKDSKKTE
jgi:hypothetical protein